MPQAITNLNDLNTKRGTRRFDSQKYFEEGDSHDQIFQHFADLHGGKIIDEETENASSHENAGENEREGEAEEEEDDEVDKIKEEDTDSPMEEWLSPQGTEALFEAKMH